MPLFKSVLRKYTPPTCTLEIKARESPLSRWVKLPVLNHLEFKLSFDDPRSTQEKRVTIWGDRDELEALCSAVQTYVQNFIDQAAGQLLISPEPAAAAVTSSPKRSENGNGAHAANPFEGAIASAPSVSKRGDSPGNAGETNLMLRGMLSPTPYLQPRGLLAHDLFLGPLATAESGPVVPLRALQLFDLTTALDEYSAQMVALPKIERKSRFRVPTVPIWTYATAAVVLVMAGLAPSVMKLLNKPQTQTALLVPSPESSPIEPTPLGSEVTPSPLSSTSGLPTTPNPTTSPGVNPTLSPTSRPTVATSPGSASTAPTPLPSPTFSLAPPPASLGNSSASKAPTPLPSPNFSLSPPASFGNSAGSGSFPGVGTAQKSSSQASSQVVTPKRSVSSSNIFQIPDPTPRVSNRRKVRSTATVATLPSPTPEFRPRFLAPSTVAGGPTWRPLPSDSNSSINLGASNTSPSPLTLPSSLPIPGNSPPLPSPNTSSSFPRSNTPRDTDTAALPRVSPAPIVPPIPDEPVAITVPPLSQATPLITSTPSPSPLPSNTPAIQSRGETTADNNKVATNSRLSNTIPQVAEVRDKLQQRWKPPVGLTQSLEYSLVFSGDGSLERIIPLSEAAKKYMGSTGMPMLGGKPFVSPIEGGGNSKIRVVLNSDGKVETHSE